VIAVGSGPAVAGGMELALWCDRTPTSQQLTRVPLARHNKNYYAYSDIFVTTITAFEGVICALWSAAATWAFTAGASLPNHTALSPVFVFVFV
jgi:hypothetical protein